MRKETLLSAAMMCSLFAMPVAAQETRVPVIYLDDYDPIELAARELARPGMSQQRNVVVSNQETTFPKLHKAPGKTCALTVKINDYDYDEVGNFSLIYAFPAKDSGLDRPWGYMMSTDEAYLDGLEAGVSYDLFMCASSVNRSYVIIREGVVIEEDTAIEVSVKECTECIEMHALNPDGSLMVLESYSGGELVQDGYFTHQYLKSFIHKDWGQLGVIIGNIFRTRNADGEITENNIARIYTTPSEDYMVAQIDYSYDVRTGWTTVLTAANEFKSTVVKSNPADYYTISDKYTPSLYEYKNAFEGTSDEAQYAFVNSVGICMNYVRDGFCNINATMLQHGDTPEEELCRDIRMCYPAGGIGVHNALAAPILVEDPYTMLFSTGDIMGCLTPMAMNTADGVRRYPYPAHPDWNSLNNEDGMSKVPLTGMASYFDNPEIVYGANSAPIFDFRMYDYGFANQMFQISYKGMYGEDRSVDCLAAEIHFLRDGEELWTDYRDIQDFRYSSLSEQNIRSDVDFTIINRNLTVDGLEASNESHLIYDESREDYTPPTLTHLQYRSISVNDLCNRFETAADGMLEFYAGDYFPTDTSDGYGTYYAEKAPAKVKLEYSPYGKDEWSELEVINEEALTLLPSFGHFYSAKLQNVTKASENGWYDVRIMLADDSDNSVTQRISPAFKIEELSGVEMTASDNSIKVVGKNIMAPEGSVVYSANGMVVNGKSLATGVYFVRSGSKTVKVFVK